MLRDYLINAQAELFSCHVDSFSSIILRTHKKVKCTHPRRKNVLLFLCNSRMRPGVTRKQLIEHLKDGADKKEWELVRKGIVSHWLFKVGDRPGFLAILNCDSLDEARTLVDKSPLAKAGLVELDIDPVDHFPDFD